MDKKLLFIAVCVIWFIILVIVDTFAAQWIAIWDANDEPDLFAYRLEFLTLENDWAMAWKGADTTCIFETPFDSVCARAFAYDSSGNVSQPSEVVCTRIILGDINRDGHLNTLDLLEFNWHIQQSGFIYDAKMDINQDSLVNVLDKLQLMFLIKNQGE